LLWGIVTRPEADHSPPSRAEVKKSGAVPPFPLYSFLACTVTILHLLLLVLVISLGNMLCYVMLPGEYFFKLNMCK
jgi:hypothetical protein